MAAPNGRAAACADLLPNKVSSAFSQTNSVRTCSAGRCCCRPNGPGLSFKSVNDLSLRRLKNLGFDVIHIGNAYQLVKPGFTLTDRLLGRWAAFRKPSFSGSVKKPRQTANGHEQCRGRYDCGT